MEHPESQPWKTPANFHLFIGVMKGRPYHENPETLKHCNFLFFVGSFAKIPAKFSFFPLEIEKCSVQSTGMSWKLGSMVDNWVKYPLESTGVLTGASPNHWCFRNPIPNHRKWMYSKPFLNNGRYINVPTSTGFLARYVWNLQLTVVEARAHSIPACHQRSAKPGSFCWLSSAPAPTTSRRSARPTETIPRKLQPFVNQRWNVPGLFVFFPNFSASKNRLFFWVHVFLGEAGTG